MRLLSRMIGGEALRGIGMEHAWRRKPPLGNRDHAFPRHPRLLTAAAQNVPPHAKHPFPEHAEAVQIPGYCVVVEVALHNCTEPCAGVRRSVVHACAELLLNLLQLCPHTPTDCQALYAETPVPVFSADVRVSSPGELHPEALAEPSVRLSPHSAPIRQTCRSYRCSSARKEPLVPWRDLEERRSHGPCD